MSAPIAKLRIAVQTETSLLRLRSRQAFRALALLAIACVFVLLAVTVLNEAAFDALSRPLGPILAGVIVGAVDLCCAALLMHIALAEPEESEEERLAEKLREITYTSLNEDLDAARDEVRAFVQDVRQIQKTVGDVTSGIRGATGLAMDLLGILKSHPVGHQSSAPSQAPPEQS